MTAISELAGRIRGLLGERPHTFYELLRALPDAEYRDVLRAWGALREQRVLARDPDGRYVLTESK